MAEGIRNSFEDFRRLRREIRTNDYQVQGGAALGIGILIGGGFPGSAAALSLLVEQASPDVDWAWREADENA
jgi:hypothetical protein